MPRSDNLLKKGYQWVSLMFLTNGRLIGVMHERAVKFDKINYYYYYSSSSRLMTPIFSLSYHSRYLKREIFREKRG